MSNHAGPPKRQGLGEGTVALGAWLFLREPLVALSAASLGYDYVCIDMQHGLSDYSVLGSLLTPLAVHGTTPVVRVLSNDGGMIGRVMDAGARAVIVPMISTAAEARNAVEACFYAPSGRRSFGPLAASVIYGSGYLSSAEALQACIPMIETAEGLANLSEILAVPGIRNIYVGPSDLALSLNIELDPNEDHPRLVQALDRIADTALRAGVIPGIHSSPALAGRRAKSGYRMITVGYDWAPLVTRLDEDLSTTRKAVMQTG